jgi:hypothetical protein
MGSAPRPGVLVALPGGAQRGAAGLSRAVARAVAIPAIAVAAQEEDLPAGGLPADDVPERIHRPPRGGEGMDNRRGVCEEEDRCNRPRAIRPEGPG